MKVKLKLVAKNDIIEDGKVVRTETIKDALQVVNLDGNKLAVPDFGKQLSNLLITSQLPQTIQDVIDYRRQLEKIHDNNGEDFEVDEEYIPIIKEGIKNVYPVITYAAAIEWLDKALLKAKNKELEPKK